MIRRAVPTDVETVRRLRLRMLRASPEAFVTTVEQAAALAPHVWIERLQPDAHPTFLAEGDDGQALGMVVALLPTESTPVELVSMWVEPPARGSGVADDLVEHVISWARSLGAAAVRLDVMDGNEPARRLYQRHGFEPCGVEVTSDGRRSLAMVCRVSSSG